MPLGKLAHLLYIAFYFVGIFSLLRFLWVLNFTTMLILIMVYAVSIAVAFSPFAERLWRKVSGIRLPRIKKLEKDRLHPLFDEVYQKAKIVDRYIQKGISIYISEEMDINAYAFGGGTLILTRGCLEFLEDEPLKGLIAHELGHFSNGDTTVSLVSNVGNLPISLFFKIIHWVESKLDALVKKSPFMGLVKFVFSIVIAPFKLIEFIGSLILEGNQGRKSIRLTVLPLDVAMAFKWRRY